MRKAPVVLLLAGLALIAGPRWVGAQDPLLVHVPFAFVVNGTQLPAGDYRVVREFGEHTLVIQNRDARAGVVTIFEDGGTTAMNAKPSLYFKTVGERHYLVQVAESGRLLDVMPVTDARFAKAVTTEKGHRVTN